MISSICPCIIHTCMRFQFDPFFLQTALICLRFSYGECSALRISHQNSIQNRIFKCIFQGKSDRCVKHIQKRTCMNRPKTYCSMIRKRCVLSHSLSRTAIRKLDESLMKSKAARGRAAIQNIPKRRETRRTPKVARDVS